MFKKLILLSALLCILFPWPTLARGSVDYWYIQDFSAKFELRADSTLLVTEKITADCGEATDKHGIFRILPEQALTPDGVIKTPVELVSITDWNGVPQTYSSSRNYLDKTVTWKIGDPDVTVQGVNRYQITYLVKNAVRFGNAKFDEFYWNLNGAFWDIEIDTFTADIVFPAGINQTNATIDYYSGALGSKEKGNVSYEWLGTGLLRFKTANLQEREGVTASVTFPKGLIQPYQPTFWEKYSLYFFALIPIIAFIICFTIWKNYGKDPKANKTVIAEYEPPANMSPLQLGVLYHNDLNNKLISASIIDLAVKGFLKIEELEKSSLFSGKDFKLTKTNSAKSDAVLCLTEKILYEKLFADKSEVQLSQLKNKFFEHIGALQKTAKDEAIANGYIYQSGTRNMIIMIMVGVGLSVLAGCAYETNTPLAVALFLSTAIVILFGIVMPRVTEKGAETIWQIKGFKLYMETAEKYRQQFNEKENIFEKYLPYAMVFGITKLWVNKMKELYGEDYFNRYHPAWFYGAALTSFDADGFNSAVSGLSSAIASNMGTTSGASGGGSSGGGGGGGGGGGW